MAHHIFQLESELQNIPEAAPKASPSFSVSEKLVRYASSALSGMEHLTLLVGKESVALALIRYFGSLKALARAAEGVNGPCIDYVTNLAVKLSELGINDPAVDDFLRALLQKLRP
jgi:hypothetical protein